MPCAVPPARSWRHHLLSQLLALRFSQLPWEWGLGGGRCSPPVPQTHTGVRGGHVWAQRGTGGYGAGIWNTGTFLFNSPPPCTHGAGSDSEMHLAGLNRPEIRESSWVWG